MNFKIPNVKELSDARKRQLFYMALGMVFIFVGVPLATYFLSNWNSLLSDDDNYIHLSKPDFAADDNIENENIFAIAGFTTNMQESILWDNITGSHTLILTEATNQDIGEIYWITKYRVSDLINNDMGSWSVSINGTGAECVITLFTYDPGDTWDSSDYSNISIKYAGEKTVLHRNNFDHNTTFKTDISTLDLMEHKINYGDGYLIFCIKSQDFTVNENIVVVYTTMFSTGDLIGFSFEYYDYSTGGLISENTILQWGGAIIGVVCLTLAMMSTTFWNPSQPNNPGFVDRWIGRGTKWVSGKNKKRRNK